MFIETEFSPSGVRIQESFSGMTAIYFFMADDSTQLNRQDPDSGEQYRSDYYTRNQTLR
ncbi:peptide-methionine (S)-S-oxide reductase [Nostoc sp.]|uniref:peptide-methionine (S)-S-oxide reductase n=1 Tax=Nostoc sp. TaxID=1180 RepID=UPI003FA5B917